MRLQDACKDLLADAEARKLSEATRSKYELLFKQFAVGVGVQHGGAESFHLPGVIAPRSNPGTSSRSTWRRISVHVATIDAIGRK